MNLSTDGGVPIGYKKSEFYSITSTGKGHYAPIDLEGALQVVMVVDNSDGQLTGGWVTDEPVNGSPRMWFSADVGTVPLTINSTDGRLYFESQVVATVSTLLVWVIRG